jgi:hypothetical protein
MSFETPPFDKGSGRTEAPQDDPSRRAQAGAPQDERAGCICEPWKKQGRSPSCPAHGGYPDAGGGVPDFVRGMVAPAPTGEMAACGPWPEWDKHPLTRERLAASARIAVVGKRDGQGWKVCLLGGAAMLAPAEARRLAQELIEMADICEGRWS